MYVYIFIHVMIILGNLISDIACTTTKADCAIINSGTLRSDVVHDDVVFKLKVSNMYHVQYTYVIYIIEQICIHIMCYVLAHVLIHSMNVNTTVCTKSGKRQLENLINQLQMVHTY